MVDENKPPRFWHKAFWVGVWEARKVSEWDGRCFGVFALSGIQTTVFNAVYAFLFVQWTAIKAAVSAAVSKAVSFSLALLEVFTA